KMYNMGKKKETNGAAKKEARKKIFEKLSASLSDYKDVMKDKKIVSRLKKISKVLAAGVINATEKQSGKLGKGKKKTAGIKSTPVKEMEPVI
ncbi:MAG TPA: hypothetical protein PKC72_14420, partial [Chitinophagaceae bacterium]|nr:hypothetical protein [Chitinophagaceae bacterium]